MKTFLMIALFTAGTAVAKWPEGTKPFASATVLPKSGSSVHGTVDFAKHRDRLLVRVTLDKLPPGEHGFHVHESGDCSAADASSAGEHFDVGGHRHGAPTALPRHAGDLGNLLAPAKGVTVRTVSVPAPEKGFDWRQIVNRSIVVHAQRDDLKTDPSGDSGARIGCGVIRPTSPLSD